MEHSARPASAPVPERAQTVCRDRVAAPATADGVALRAMCQSAAFRASMVAPARLPALAGAPSDGEATSARSVPVVILASPARPVLVLAMDNASMGFWATDLVCATLAGKAAAAVHRSAPRPANTVDPVLPQTLAAAPLAGRRRSVTNAPQASLGLPARLVAAAAMAVVTTHCAVMALATVRLDGTGSPAAPVHRHTTGRRACSYLP